MVITIIMFAILVLLGFPVTYVYEKFLALATSSIIFSMVLSIFLYLRSLTVPKEQLAQGGNSGELHQQGVNQSWVTSARCQSIKNILFQQDCNISKRKQNQQRSLSKNKDTQKGESC